MCRWWTSDLTGVCEYLERTFWPHVVMCPPFAFSSPFSSSSSLFSIPRHVTSHRVGTGIQCAAM